MEANIRWIVLCIATFVFSAGYAQQEEEPIGPPSTAEEFEAQYAERIKQTHLFDVYIPADLEDAIRELERLTPEASLLSYKNAPEDVVVRKLFFGLGRWIIYNWGFYEGSRLSHFLRESGIYDPDDMARVIMISFHRKLNARPIDFEGQVKTIQERVETERKNRLKEGTVIHEERRKIDPKEK